MRPLQKLSLPVMVRGALAQPAKAKAQASSSARRVMAALSGA
jgi:hypothetical protein